MASRLESTMGNDGEFRYAVGAEVGYCLAGDKAERRGAVVEVGEHFVTVRDAQGRNEIRLGAADSIRVLDVGARDHAAAVGTSPAKPIARKTDEEKRAAKREYMRRWKAKRRGMPCGYKACEKCHEQYPVSSNAQRFCPTCKAAGAKAGGKPAPRGKPVAARTTTAAPTAADQDNPQANGGMTLVRVPRVAEVPAAPKYAPSTAAVDPLAAPLTPAASPAVQRFSGLVGGTEEFRWLLVQQAERYERLAAAARELAASV